MSPLIVGIGGTTRPGSTSERALRLALDLAEAQGARTEILAGRALDLPAYDPTEAHRPPAACRLIELLRAADGVILSTPAYHGGPSGMIKNALDYAEDMARDARPYLDGRSVGLIVAAYGPQAMGTTLSAMRSVIHALRGWPTPLAVALDGRTADLGPEGGAAAQIAALSGQVVSFASRMRPAT